MGKFAVRAATRDDHPGVAALLHPWFSELTPGREGIEVDERLAALEAAAYHCVAIADDAVVGVAGLGAMWLEPTLSGGLARPAEVFAVYVARAWLGIGVGRALLDDVETEARRLGYSDILAISGARHREIGYPFWNRRYGAPYRVDPDHWGEGYERVVWRLALTQER